MFQTYFNSMMASLLIIVWAIWQYLSRKRALKAREPLPEPIPKSIFIVCFCYSFMASGTMLVFLEFHHLYSCLMVRILRLWLAFRVRVEV